MNITEALPKRFSCRAFDTREVEAEKLDLLRSEVERANAESGLHLQLFGPGEGRLDLSKKMFAGEAPCYLAFVGEDTPVGKERVGYFGERVVLSATALGLGTCWVAGTFDRKTVVAEVGEGEVLHDGGAKSSRMEKMPGIAAEAFRRACVDPERDVLVVISASGKNAAPVEMLRTAKAAGVRTIAISSSEYRSHGAVLLDEADIPVDCFVPYGDAVIDVGGKKMGGLSTYASLFILNSILIEGAQKALARGTVPPIYTSGNVEGGMALNAELERRYFGRVKRL